MEPLKRLEWRLSFLSWVREESRVVSGPASWRRGNRSSRTWPSEQTMPVQSQGAAGVEGSQVSRAASGSWRLRLKEMRAVISAEGWAKETAAMKDKSRRRRIVAVIGMVGV